jgi:integrase
MPHQPKQPGQPKRKKSTYGGGSVYRRKDGRYVASIKNPVTGTRIERYGKSQKEAEKLLEDIKFEIRQGTLATGPRQTVRQFLEFWLEDVHRPKIRPGTYRGHRAIIYNHLIPAFGNVQLSKLTPGQVQALYARLQREGMTPGGVITVHAVLHNALKYAVKTSLVAQNICDRVEIPRAQKHDVNPLTGEQVRMLLDVAKGHKFEACLCVAATLGLRRGELLALHWSDVDLENRLLYVRYTLTREPGKGQRESEPKTASSRRKILMPRFVADVLRQHRLQQMKIRLEVGEKWVDHDLVFSNRFGGYISEHNLYWHFHALLKKAGLPPMRFHDLRHSAATVLLSMHVHPKVVQEILGHSTIRMTMDTYSHVLPSMQQDAVDKLERFFRQ